MDRVLFNVQIVKFNTKWTVIHSVSLPVIVDTLIELLKLKFSNIPQRDLLNLSIPESSRGHFRDHCINQFMAKSDYFGL